jgi:hypothetical protein
MKAEERHDLNDNDLGSWLRYGLPVFLRQNGSYVLLVLALGFLGWQLWNRHVQNQEFALQQAWDELNAVDPRPLALRGPPSTMPDAKLDDNPAIALQRIIDENENKAVRAQATLELGNYYLLCVLFDSYPANSRMDRDDALNQAEKVYQKALVDFSDDLLVLGKARLGLAAVAEDRGNWDEAKKQYETLADKTGPFKGTPIVELGAGKLSKLEDRKKAPDLAAMAQRAARIRLDPLPEFTTPRPMSLSPSGLNSTNLPGSWTVPAAPFQIGPTLPPLVLPTTAPATAPQ